MNRAWSWERINRLRAQRRVQNAAALGLVILGPVLAFLTFLVLGPLDQGMSSANLRVILLADFIYVLLVATLVLGRVAQMVAARRARSAGSRLHLRLTGVFALLALIPTVCVAIFAVLTVNFGLEGWFSDRVQRVLGSSLAAAQAYEEEHRQDLAEDARALSAYLEANRRAKGYLTDGEVRELVGNGQKLIQRGLAEAFVIDAGGEIRARGEGSYLFNFEKPSTEDIQTAAREGIAIIEDWDRNEFRAIVNLPGYVNRYLYVSRIVDGSILKLLDDTQQTVKLYQQLENDRGRLLFEFGLLYLGFALILILAAIWLGLWFAERLARPVGRLAGAAQRVGGGDLMVQVREEKGDDEIAMLGRYFNQMTRQLKQQRDTLLESTEQIEKRRRLFDSVLTSVTSGVIALDADGRITLANRSAEALLDLRESDGQGVALGVAIPEFLPAFDNLRSSPTEALQQEVRLTRNGKTETLLVRMSARMNEETGLEGYVVAFDDVSDLVAAQRSAAWGDVARRIAHEIKNPLTPIQLSAERIKRKFGKLVGDEKDSLEQLTGVIVRQTEDLRHIVNEFSKFARMPQPQRKPVDLLPLVSNAVLLQDSNTDLKIVSDLPDQGIQALVDETMISQALINLIKNAGEAIETLYEKGAPDGHVPEVRVKMRANGDQVMIRISDNGIGLPEDRGRLFEPYVTTREKGTGLGLPIVKKIIEEHGGTLQLLDAEPFTEGARVGACAEILLPLDGAAKK
ncbi:sensor histidine kinase NtrY-like [Donghicola tyrosinivorans]|uniref:histidine kinase n=1 Tax=Donghicola tyrosinivorans TaxID=1652492 RepID=A0A2T0WTQ6_9RHOB|nr:PAS domain-containing sensor histidine kinase [Donghicola tyrosinivorans]PRY90060.1 two-component system nitrogen regulation sensor histidine kinase NtrY [Donghicola tyrosinivorans]